MGHNETGPLGARIAESSTDRAIFGAEVGSDVQLSPPSGQEFKRLAYELFDELNRLASSTFAPAGTVLFRRDEPSRSVYVVRSGRVALLWPDAEETTPMEMLEPGSILGLPAAINGTYSATAKAVADSELGAICADCVVELLATTPSLCRTAMRMMSLEVARMRSSIAERCPQIE